MGSGLGSALVELRSTEAVSEKVKQEPFLSVTLGHPADPPGAPHMHLSAEHVNQTAELLIFSISAHMDVFFISLLCLFLLIIRWYHLSVSASASLAVESWPTLHDAAGMCF